MNLHPIFVHFPVALFTVYAVMELIPSRKLRAHISWFFVKAAFILIGIASSSAAYLTGTLIEEEFEQDKVYGPIVEMHSFFAGMTIAVFAVIALAYLILFLQKSSLQSRLLTWQPWQRISSLVLRIYASRTILPLLALIGLGCVTVTGALGGSIVYGESADPLVGIIYRVLGL